MKWTTNSITKRSTTARLFVGAALAAMLATGIAAAPDEAYAAEAAGASLAGALAGADREAGSRDADAEGAKMSATGKLTRTSVSAWLKASSGDLQIEDSEDSKEQAQVAQAEDGAQAQAESDAKAQAEAEAERSEKILAYDPDDIAAIGTQESSGHTICCPSFSCAYADAVLDGTVRDHSYYTCSCCTWPDWGGGGSSFRCVGDDQELLREAYDQIAQGRPTVIHVAGVSGEHWIALIGYTGVEDPDALTFDNFIALDPWDGAQIVATDRYSLYGDGCEHISDR